jgi:predicted Zn-dependent protease
VTASAESDVLEKVAARARASQRPKSRLPRVLGSVLLCAVLLAAAAVGGAFAGLWRLPGLAGELIKPAQQPLETQTAPSLNAPSAHEAQPAQETTPAPRAEAAPTQPSPSAPQAEAAPAEQPATKPEASAPQTRPSPGAEPTQPSGTEATGDSTRASAEAAAAKSEDETSQAQGGLYAQQSEARRLLREKQPQAAEAVLLRVLEQAPNDLTSATLLAQSYISQKHGPKALKAAEKLVEMRPKRAVFRVLLGDARQLNGDRPGAIDAFRAALTLDPKSREAKQRLAHFGEEAAPSAQTE